MSYSKVVEFKCLVLTWWRVVDLKELQTRSLVQVLGGLGTIASLIVIISSCNSKVEASGPQVTKKVFFDITIGGEAAGRIISLLPVF